MKPTQSLTLLLAVFTLGACGGLGTRGCEACREHAMEIGRESEALNALGYAEFPEAEPPHYEHDGRSQKERDLEVIGRKN
ncbi:MAG: hypothetical protein QF489_01765 [Planctomycetota bacterium]|nr:hypothetical protein [Planctomycetota bacterium]